MMKRGKQTNSILGLTLDGRRLEGALLKRGRDGSRVHAVASTELGIEPLEGEPELVAGEIGDRLAANDLKEKHCIVGLPLDWLLTSMIRLPDMPEEHMDGFIRLQAEKSFPLSLSDLCLSVSRFDVGAGERHALLTAVPRRRVLDLESRLQLAGLKPLSFSLGVVALQEALGAPGLSIFVSTEQVSIVVSTAAGPVCIRSLPDAWCGDAQVRRIDPRIVGRELRITLGQLPDEVRAGLTKVRLLGSPGLLANLESDLKPRVEALGLVFEAMPEQSVNGVPLTMPFSGVVPAAAALAARYLENPKATLEFLPPKVNRWQVLATRLASRKSGILGAIAGVILVTTLIAFFWQGRQLSNLESEWNGMKKQVAELEDLQSRIRKFRPWYDETQPTLRMMRAISRSFPANGDITAKSLEVRPGGKITIAGSARHNKALLDLSERLSKVEGVFDVKLENLRGVGPIQFSIVCRWQPGGAQ